MSTSAYYPEGWDREHMLNSAATDEILSLTEEQRTRFRESLKADVGEQGYEEFFNEMYKREMKAKGTTPPISEPPFMQAIRLHEQRCGPDSRWAQWGFVVFKSPEVRDAARWEACRQRFDTIIRDQVDCYRGYEGLEECVSRMKFEWVGDVEDADGSFASIAQAYASMNPPMGLHHSLCLYITPSSLDSILNSPLPSTSKRKSRKDVPFVVAVSAQAGLKPQRPSTVGEEEEEEEEYAGANWRGYFNVAVEALLDSFFPVVANDSMTPFEIGGLVVGEDIYCDHTRSGIHKAGVGYWDRRRTGRAGTGI